MIDQILSIGSQLIKHFFPDKAQAQEAQLKLLEMAQNGELARMGHEAKIVEAQSANIQAEANSDSWLTKSWRPLTMLVFTGLIVARWFGYSAPNITPAEYMELWSIVKLGMGGYIVGRSCERVAQSLDLKKFFK